MKTTPQEDKMKGLGRQGDFKGGMFNVIVIYIPYARCFNTENSHV